VNFSVQGMVELSLPTKEQEVRRHVVAPMGTPHQGEPSRLRLAIVMPSAGRIGGAEEMLLQFIRHAPAAGLELFIAFLEDGPLVDMTRQTLPTIEVCAAGRVRNPFRLFQTIAQLRRWLAGLRPTAVLSWMTKAQIYAGPAARLAGLPSVCFQHGLPDGGLIDVLSRKVPCHGFLACSEFAAHRQEAMVKVPVTAVCSTVDLERMERAEAREPSEWRKRLGLPKDRKIIMLVGRLQRWKGMHVFVQAVALLRHTHPEVLGVIVGGEHHLEREYAEDLRRMVDHLNLGQKLWLVGPQTNVPEWMQAADVVTHTSDREPFGLVVLEAMSLGKPVIATKPGGPEEIIHHERDGLLVPFGDAESLSRAIARFLDSQDLARSCGIAARHRARQFDGAGYPSRVRSAIERILQSAA